VRKEGHVNRMLICGIVFSVMSNVSGAKISDNHTTVIEAASGLVTFLHKDPRVRKIVPGKINSECGVSGSGPNRLKIIDQDGCIMLAISGSSSHQEIRVYLKDIETQREAVKENLQSCARDEGFEVDFLDRRAV
jgi:hypothetical protein